MTGLAVRRDAARGLLLARPPAGRGRGRWSTPVRIRTGAAAAVALACCLAALTGLLLGQLRGDFQAIGQRDASDANATTGSPVCLAIVSDLVVKFMLWQWVLLADGDECRMAWSN